VARTVPDNLGMLFRRNLVMFGPREVLLTSDEPVVEQFLNGRRLGPIGMSEEKDESQMAEEQAMADAGHNDGSGEDVRGIVPQIVATPGTPDRQAVHRRKERVMGMLHTLPEDAQRGSGTASTTTTVRSTTRFAMGRRASAARTTRGVPGTPRAPGRPKALNGPLPQQHDDETERHERNQAAQGSEQQPQGTHVGSHADPDSTVKLPAAAAGATDSGRGRLFKRDNE